MLGMEVAKAREDNLRAVWFTAGAAVAVACMQRAAVAALVEQWRMWMFVALNLLLLAILFTSTSTSSGTTTSSAGLGGRGESNTGDGDKKEGQKMEESGRKRRKASRCSKKKMDSDNAWSGSCREVVEEVINVEDDEDEDGEGSGRANGLMCLSKEELNQRVEAFIAMFRQQLISDAKNRSMGFQYST